MAQIFSDLSYNNEYATPIGRPTQALSALYKKKEDDYNYVLDNLHKTETALNNVPHHSKDAHIIQAAKDKYTETFNRFSEEGDLENKIIDTKKLANDLTNNSGLLEAQQVAQTKKGFIDSLKDRFSKGEISKSDMNRAIQDAEDNYKGLQFNEDTNSYVGNYTMRDVLDKQNFSENVANILNDFKANKIVLTNSKGEQIVRDPNGSGYMIAGTKESVDTADLTQAAKSYLMNDPDFKDRVEDDLYYETKSLLYNPSTGERRDMTIQDLKNLVGTKVSNEIASAYGVDNLDNLEEVLESNGSTIEDLYKSLRAEQMINSTIQLGVGKESYEKYEAKYLQDWVAKEQMSSGNKEDIYGATGILHSYLSTDNLTSEDTEKISQQYTTNEDSIKGLKAEISDLENSYNNNPNSVNPDDIDRKKEQLKQVERTNSIIRNRMNTIVQANPEITRQIKTLATNSFAQNKWFEDNDVYNYKNRYGTSIGIDGLSINKGTVESLVYKMLGNDISDNELQQYIQLDKNKIMAEAYLKNADFSSYYVDKEKTYQDILEKGVTALEETNDNHTIKGKVLDAYNDTLNTSTRNFRLQLNNIVDNLKTKVESEDLNYTEEFKVFNPPDVKPEDARNNPIHQLNNFAKQLPNIDSNYYTQLSSAITGLDLPTTIEQLADTMDLDVSSEDGDILWDKAIMTPSIDTMEDIKNGTYSPVIVMQVPVKTGDKNNPTKTLQVPVNYNEPSYISKYQEAVKGYRDSLLKKAKTQQLSKSDELVLNRLNTNLYNLNNYGSELDLLNLYNAKNGETIPFEYWKGYETQIKSYKYSSPQDMAFYLTEGKGEDERFWAVDKNGKYSTVTSEELKGDTWTALGANSPKGLKELLANMVMDTETSNNYRVDLNTTVDVSTIFGDDIKEGVVPQVTQKAADSLKTVKTWLPNLVLTDGLRPDATGYGAEDSEHKYANAVDFRNNEDGKRLASMSTVELNKIGIKSAEVHSKGTPNEHIHVEFLK